MSVISSPAISYGPPVKNNHGSYKYTRVLSDNGGQTISLNRNSPTEILTSIPNRVVNLARSNVSMDLRIPATASKEHNLFTNGAGGLFSRISLYSRAGTYLCDLTDAATYTRTVQPMINTVDSSRSLDVTRCQPFLIESQNKGRPSMNSCSNSPASTADAGGRNGTRPNADDSVNSADVDDTEPQYVTKTSTGDDLCLSLSIPLRDLAPHTVMSLDKDLYFNQSLVLRTSFAPFNRIGFTTTSGTSPEELTEVPEVTSFRVNLAVETNSQIAEGVRSQVMSGGLQQLVPYVYENVFKTPTASSEHSHQIRLNRSAGHSLLHMYSACFNGSTTRSASIDLDNRFDAVLAGPKKVISTQTSVDNDLQSEYRLECDKGLDYEAQRHLMQDSVAAQQSDVWRYNRCELNSWRGGKCVNFRETDDILDGLDLSAERIIVIDRKTQPQDAGAVDQSYRSVIYSVVQRKMLIAASGDIVLQ
jgi:hypothetical protein